MSEFLVVTGMSGAGRSTAADSLEDLGWFVIDNLPAALIIKMAEMIDLPGAEIERVALVIGRGGGAAPGSDYFEDLPDVLDALRADRNRVRVLFLDASDDVLVRRYEGTRRRHPLAARGVEESIADERRLLAPVRDRADLFIDTGELNTNQLRTRILEAFGDEGGAESHADLGGLVRLQVRPPARCRRGLRLPLPAQPVLDRGAAALQRARRTRCATTCWASPRRKDFLEKVDELLTGILPSFVREGKSYLTIALGLHRRPAPLGGPGRGAGGAPRASTATRCRSSTGTWTGDPDDPSAARRGGPGRGARHRGDAAGRPPLRRAGSPPWSRWPTTADRAGGCASCSTWWPWATCASAWSPWPPRTRPWRVAFEHRFDEGELAGHALGNLILAGLVEATGDLVSGVRAAADLLGAEGEVLPATVERVVLKAEAASGQVAGQVAVSRAGNIQTVSLVPGDAQPPRLAIERILAADQIVIGPGSLFTSVLAAAAVGGIADAVARSPGPAGLRLQPAPPAARDGRIRRGGPRGGSDQA